MRGACIVSFGARHFGHVLLNYLQAFMQSLQNSDEHGTHMTGSLTTSRQKQMQSLSSSVDEVSGDTLGKKIYGAASRASVFASFAYSSSGVNSESDII